MIFAVGFGVNDLLAKVGKFPSFLQKKKLVIAITESYLIFFLQVLK